jgi:hypothetical protein
MTLGEEVIEDYLSLRLSLRAHPMELLRPHLPGLTAHADLPAAPLRIAGLRAGDHPPAPRHGLGRDLPDAGG